MPLVHKLKAPAEFFTNPQPSTAIEGVKRELAEEREKNLVDPQRLREMQDWSYLNGKFVGAEEPRSYNYS